MLVCDQKDHDNEEILTVCLNINCKEKRACCLHCIEKHQSHKKDLKTLSKLASWQEESCQNYDAFRKKMDKILHTIKSTEKYLSDLSVDPEVSFEDLSIDDFEDYISKLIKIQLISQPFNKILSDLLPQLEPLSQLVKNDDRPNQSIQFDQKSIISESKIDKKIISTQQSQQSLQPQNLQTDEQQQQEERKIRMKKYIYQELIEKTHKVKRQNELDIHQYPIIHKKSLDNMDQYKTIILIGTSQSGKQKLINLFLNYYYGVEFYDPYRFEMIDDIDILKQKQNNEYDQMKVYYIPPQNGQTGLRIIYTPDYSEDLIYEDQIIEDKIYNMLRNTISLNQCIMIGFIIAKKIGISQYFMLESILSKFSNDLINNIVFLFPDSTLDNPIQKDILLSKTQLINEIQSPVINMIPTITNSWYLKFNISTLDIQNNNTNKQENKQLWEMGKKSFQELIHKQLQYKINLENLDQMRNYYCGSFLHTFSSCVNASKQAQSSQKRIDAPVFQQQKLISPKDDSVLQQQKLISPNASEFKQQFSLNELAYLKKFCLNISELTQSRQKCIDQFNILYKRETFGYREQKEYLERRIQDLNTRIQSDLTSNKDPYASKDSDYSDYYELKNADSYSDQVNDLGKSLNEQIQQHIQSYCKLIQNKSEYNKGFEEFYNYFKQYINDMQKYLIKILSDHTLHFQFNSILISINPCQYQYYDHLIKQEEKYKQEDWSKRCQILKNRCNFFIYTDDYIRGSKQLLFQKWKDFQFERKRHPDAPDWCKDGAIVYYKIDNQFSLDIRDGKKYLKKRDDGKYLKVSSVCYYNRYKNGNPQNISDLSSRSNKQDYTELIQPRISDDCDKHFQEYLKHEQNNLPHWE